MDDPDSIRLIRHATYSLAVTFIVWALPTSAFLLFATGAFYGSDSIGEFMEKTWKVAPPSIVILSLYNLYRFYLVLKKDFADFSGLAGFILSLISFTGALYISIGLYLES
jgi:hypothetical protein